MIKLLQITREELSYHLRQWVFYLTSLGMPLMVAALGAIPQLQQATEETPLASVETIFTETETIEAPTGYVDEAEIIQQVPDIHAEKLLLFPDTEAAAEALDSGDIESYYLIAADYVQSGTVTQFSNRPQLLAGVDDVITQLLRDNLLQSLDDPRLANRLEQPVNLVRRGPPRPVFSFIPSSTDLQELTAAGIILVLFAYLINVGGVLLLKSLQRESQARVFEVLVASTTAEQFIGGKLLALTLLTLSQAGLTLVAASLVYGRNSGGFGPSALPVSTILLSTPYLLVGYLAYSGLVMSFATIWPNLPESATLLAMLRLAAFSPVLGVLFILPNPDGIVATILILLPPTAPLLMPFRLLLGAIPFWQWGLGLFGLIVTAAFLIWISIRLFRAQTLLTGRSATLPALWATLRG
ncbi:MAG: ABC transporter permease [Chloroflexota bacterium]